MTTSVVRSLSAAIFDFGGVMTEPIFRDHGDVPQAYRGLVQMFMRDFADVYHLPTGAHDLHQLEIGVISDEQFFSRLCQRWAESGGSPLDATSAQHFIFGRELVACAAMVDVVRQLRQAGFRTALLTNISRQGEAIWRRVIPVDELFTVVVDSSQVGLRKPDPAIFQLCCRRLGVEPASCLFVDDIACNVEAAAVLGMEVIRCHDPSQIAADVAQRLLGRSPSAEPEGVARNDHGH